MPAAHKQILGCVRKRGSISQISYQFHIRPTTLPLNIKCPQLFITLINMEAEFNYNKKVAFWPWTIKCEQHLSVLLPWGYRSIELF